MVAIYAERSAELAIAVLGVLKSGAAFLILDSGHPPARLADCAERSGVQAWIHADQGEAMPREIYSVVSALPDDRVLKLRGDRSHDRTDSLSAFSTSKLAVEIAPDDLAYVAFTSGSTGVPKGIFGTHRPMSHFLHWYHNTFDIGQNDRFGMLSSLSHDPLLRDILAPLWIGATLCIPDSDEINTPSRLAEWARRTRVTALHLTPAMSYVLTQAWQESDAQKGSLGDLRYVFFGGDSLAPAAVANLRSRAPGAQFFNFYGTTETPQAMSCFPIPDEPDASRLLAVPLGSGIDGVQLLVLNPAQELVGIGQIGEIHVRTPYLARGYFEAQDGHAEPFAVDPIDPSDRSFRTGDLGVYDAKGNVHFLGRSDHQIKIRGHRVELEEVEAVLRRHSSILDVAVALRGDTLRDQHLVAYVVGRESLSLVEPAHFSAPMATRVHDS